MLKIVISGKLKGMRIISLVSLFITGLAILFPAHLHASYIYDQKEITSQIIIDKQLKTISLEHWQDNLPASQQVLKENDLLEFRIKIKNSGDTKLENINAHDFLPAHLALVFHPGEFDQGNNQISWQIKELSPGEEKIFNIRTFIKKGEHQVVDGTLCLINKTEAKAESGEHDQDTASFCIVSAKKLPEAGSGTSNLALGTGIAGMFALTGIALRLFGRGKILA